MNDKQPVNTSNTARKPWPISMEMVYDMGVGICLACGEIAEDGVECDATGYECECCGQHDVCGIEWAIISGSAVIESEGE